jgi:ParB/RepB/Spo0J family partition protein
MNKPPLVMTLPMASVHPDPTQPRQHFDPEQLQELADSIEAQGLIQPITVRKIGGSKPRFQIVCGERRWRAHQLLGRDTIAAQVLPMAKGKVLLAQLTENLARADQTPLETARAYRRALDEGIASGPAELAKMLGIRQPFRIQESLSLLKLCPEAESLLDSQAISRSQAWALTAIPHEKQQRILALLEAGKLPTEAAFKAACSAPERAEVDRPALVELTSRTTRVKRLLAAIEVAGVQLAGELADDSWAGQISWNDARTAADQLRWVSKTVAGLGVTAETALGFAAVASQGNMSLPYAGGDKELPQEQANTVRTTP